MHGSTIVAEDATDEEGPTLRERWPVLAVLLLSLVVTSVDHTIVNVALPEMVREVGASTSDLQWVVDAYTLVFAGLLLSAGAFGDRSGRKRALLGGLMAFGMGSVMAATASSPESVIAGRAVMGLGGAFIMPSTLSILVNVFTGRRERAKAIAAWAAAASLGIAVGPLLGGWLLGSFSWSSVFWVNVPLLLLAAVVGRRVLPESRAGAASRPDPGGAVLSMAAIGTFVWAIIEAPSAGWLSGTTLGALALAAGFGVLFARWEARRPEPLLDLALFRDRRFAAASAALTLAFLALAGSIFLVVQYVQFVLGYTPLAAGFALVPAAAGLLVGTGLGEHLGAHVDGRRAVSTGIAVAGLGVAVQAAFADGAGYAPTGVGLGLLGLGLGIAMPAATGSVMSAVPRAKAGVGSAVNDTARELGGAVGVAVIGSIFASAYSSSIRPALDGVVGLSDEVRVAAGDNIGAALDAAGSLGADGAGLAAAANAAFVDGMQAGLWAAAAVAALGAVLAAALLPGRAPARGRDQRVPDDPPRDGTAVLDRRGREVGR